MSRPITVQYYKYPTTLHWRHDVSWLGEDDHGVWLAAPVGTVFQRGHEPARSTEHAFVQLIAPGRWWSAIFNRGVPVATYVDIVTIPRWVTDDRVEMIDLDLDVIQRRDGSVYVDDEDEFEEHRLTLEYPPHMADSARSAAARVVLAIESAWPPFDGTADHWLDLVR